MSRIKITKEPCKKVIVEIAIISELLSNGLGYEVKKEPIIIDNDIYVDGKKVDVEVHTFVIRPAQGDVIYAAPIYVPTIDGHFGVGQAGAKKCDDNLKGLKIHVKQHAKNAMGNPIKKEDTEGPTQTNGNGGGGQEPANHEMSNKKE